MCPDTVLFQGASWQLFNEALWGTALRGWREEVGRSDPTLVWPSVLTDELVSLGTTVYVDDTARGVAGETLGQLGRRAADSARVLAASIEQWRWALNHGKTEFTVVCSGRHAKSLHRHLLENPKRINFGTWMRECRYQAPFCIERVCSIQSVGDALLPRAFRTWRSELFGTCSCRADFASWSL